MRAVVQRVTRATVTIENEIAVAAVVIDLLQHDSRSLVSRVEIRPSRLQKK